MDDSVSEGRARGTRSVSKRFTLALIGVVTLLLVGFAAVAIVVDNHRMEDDLQDLLSGTGRLAQVSLAVPLWNVDTDTIANFADALLLQDSLAFVEILSEGQPVAVRSQRQFAGQPFAFFAGSPEFLVTTVNIAHEGKSIGSVRLAASREGVRRAMLLKIFGILALVVLIVASISATSIVITRRYVARPLAALQRSTGLIAGGDLDVPINITHQDEIGSLARDLNAMRGSIKTLIEERRQNEEHLEEANRTLEQKVEERTKELQAKTHELTRIVDELQALGEVARAVTSTLDLQTVLVTIITHAVRLSKSDAGGTIYEFDEATEVFEPRANFGVRDAMVAKLHESRIRLGDTAVGICAVRRVPYQIPDMEQERDNRMRDLLLHEGIRAVLAVPLLRNERIIGALVIRRRAAGDFSQSVVTLLETLAGHSVLAIQNARLFQQVREKSRQLELASQHKSDFLASMSHELRTPLNAILGFNEMLLDEVYGPVPQDMKAPLNNIQESGKHLLRLINNVLDLAKIEAGRMELALSDYWAQDLVENVRSTLRPLAADKGLEFVATVPAEIPLAYGDPGRIIQCLMNLAGNSLKFTKSGKVEISVGLQDGKLSFRVADTGIGIPPDKIGSLFTEFRQTDVTIAGEYGGTGLGLSITRKFIEMHGGRIWVESEPGVGSRFIFEIPLRVAQGVQT